MDTNITFKHTIEKAPSAILAKRLEQILPDPNPKPNPTPRPNRLHKATANSR